jgi:hypothetical protein
MPIHQFRRSWEKISKFPSWVQTNVNTSDGVEKGPHKKLQGVEKKIVNFRGGNKTTGGVSEGVRKLYKISEGVIKF